MRGRARRTASRSRATTQPADEAATKQMRPQGAKGVVELNGIEPMTS
jgi:hypothetical protein